MISVYVINDKKLRSKDRYICLTQELVSGFSRWLFFSTRYFGFKNITRAILELM